MTSLNELLNRVLREGKRGLHEGTYIPVEVTPASKKVAVGINQWRGTITVKVRGPAKSGEANRELLSYLKSIFGDAEIVRGEKSNLKLIFVRHSKDKVLKILEELLK
jgi:hypothetical protein